MGDQPKTDERTRELTLGDLEALDGAPPAGADPSGDVVEVSDDEVFSIPAPSHELLEAGPHDTLPPVHASGSESVSPAGPTPSVAAARRLASVRPRSEAPPPPPRAKSEPPPPPPPRAKSEAPPRAPSVPPPTSRQPSIHAAMATDPPPDSASVRRQSAEELVRACTAELDEGASGGRAARLHFEVAQQCETILRDAETAEKHFLAVLAIQPEHLAALRGARRAALRRKSYDDALALLESEARVTRDPSRRAALHAFRGTILANDLRDLPRAKSAFQAALELDRTNPNVLASLEDVTRAERGWAELDRLLEQHANAIQADPELKAALVLERARLHETVLEDSDGAVDLYETALSVDERCTAATDALKRLLHTKRRWRDLARVLAQEAQLAPTPADQADALWRLGRVHRDRIGDRERAIEAFEGSLERVPNSVLTLDDLATVFEDAARYDDLARILAKRIELTEEPRHKHALLHRLGRLTDEQLGDKGRALDWYLAARTISPNFAPVTHALTKLLQETGRWEELVQVLRAEVDLLDDAHRKAALFARIADITEHELGHPEEAVEFHLRAIAMVPDHSPSLGSLERLLSDAQRWRDLIEMHRRVVEQSARTDQKVANLLRIATIHDDSLFEPDQAAQAYREVLALDAKSLAGIRGLIRSAERARSYNDVVEGIERESELVDSPEETAALLQRAGEVAAFRLGDFERASQLYRRALDVRPDRRGTLVALGEVYERLGRWEALLETYEAQVPLAKSPQEQSALYHAMGQLCEMRIGRDDDATSYYEKARLADLKNAPATASLKRKLRQHGDWERLGAVLEAEIANSENATERTRAAIELGETREERLGDRDGALAAFADARGDVPAARAAIDAERRLRDTPESWELLATDLEAEAGKRQGPESIGLLLRAAEILAARLERPHDAIRCLEAVLVREGSHVLALRELERLYHATENWESLALTEATLARALREPASRIAALWRLGHLEDRGRVRADSDARATYETILSLADADPSALDALERVALERGDRKLLAEVDSKLMTTEGDPTLAAAHAARLGESLDSVDPARATEAYQAALAQDGESIAAIRGLSRMAQRLADPQLLADAARREAQVARDKGVAADLLMRSALERLDRLADEHGAVQDLEKGIELDPDHAETASMLTKLLVSRGDELRASEILSRAAGAATTPERRAALWLEVARIQSDALGSIPAGISALNRVLRSAPSHVEALRRLAELYVRDGQWMEAVNLLGRIVQLTEDPDILRTSHLELAKLWLERLGDSAEALRSVEHVLRTSPEHPGALACLADIHAADGNWDDAVRTADQLLAAAQGDTARSEALLRMARLEQRRGRHDRAQVLTLDSVALDGPGGEAALLLKSKLRTRDEWVAYATAMERHIEHCLTVGHSPIPSVLELSRVHHAQLGDPVNAAYVLERGISLSGGGTALRSELAQRLRDAGRLDDSARELHHLIAEDPTNVGAYRELAKIHAGRGQTREARIAAEPIAVLGQLGANETEWLASSAAAPLSLEDARLGAAAMRPHLPSEGAAPSVTELLATLAPFLHKVYPPDYDAFGLTSRDKEGTRQPSPLRVLANDVCRVAGVGNIDLYVHRVRSRGVAMELSDPPALFVPASIEDLSLPQQTFLLSKPVLAVALGLQAVEKLTPRELEVLVAASVRMVAPQYGDGLTSEEVLEDTKRRIQKAISRKAKKVIEERAGHIAALPPIDYAAWSAGVHQCLRQFASLAADDLVATVDITRRLEREHQGREGAELVRKSPVVQGMVRFWLSDTANSLRRADASLPTTPT